MGTVNPVNKTAYFCVGSVGPTAGGLPHVTHSKHKEQSENAGNTLERTVGTGSRVKVHQAVLLRYPSKKAQKHVCQHMVGFHWLQ